MATSYTFKKSTLWKGTAAIFILLFFGSLFTGGFGFNSDSTTNGPTANVIAQRPATPGVTEVTTTLQGFKYNPDTISVKKGDKVVLTIVNKDNVNHGLHLMQFGIMESIPPFVTKTVQFTAIETPTNGQAVPTCSQEHGETLTINVI